MLSDSDQTILRENAQQKAQKGVNPDKPDHLGRSTDDTEAHLEVDLGPPADEREHDNKRVDVDNEE